ncbi:glycosyltransferase family protein [Labilibacter marinus]|uniref:glycosyltransferase n=1 Tax=Labilibacter marinus TaxID=1477105 RepID=UPI00082F0523|nr:glycosyltransferase [Labilibacter marinus]
MPAPILLFTYNRLEHTRRTVEALQNNLLAKESDLYVFSDYGRNEEEQKSVEDVRDYLQKLSGFKSITPIFNSSNKGLAKSIIEGVNHVFKIKTKLIVLEDDLETSPYFLGFMNEALKHYNPNHIWSIAGYSPNINKPKNYSYDTYLAHRNCSWGWATWKQNWQRTDWQVSDFNHFFLDKDKRHQFDRGGNDLSIMLLKQQQQKIHSWSIRFNYSAYKHNLPSVYPTISFINNLGVDGSGTHMKKSLKYDSKLNLEEKSHYHFCPSEDFNAYIEEKFKRFYNTSFYRKTINWFKTIKAQVDIKKLH